jgi:hypothetical protein
MNLALTAKRKTTITFKKGHSRWILLAAIHQVGLVF